jgi:putative surface-exposed virulence protein
LIEWLQNNPKKVAGVIWIESSYVGTPALEGGAVVINGGGYALTINGGWLGGTSKVLDANNPSEFNVPVVFSGSAPLTINNLLIVGVTGSNFAFDAYSPNLIINNVHVRDNSTTTGGANVHGTVTVRDSTFIGNNGNGLDYGFGFSAITLKNVTAINNSGYGAIIFNSNGGPSKTVTITNSQFNYNGLDGLYVLSKGVILLANVNAIGNGRSGVSVNNCGVFSTNLYICQYQNPDSTGGVTTSAGVIIQGSNVFNDNGWDGLRVFTSGVITIRNITANNNGTDPNRTGVTFPNPFDHNAYGKGVYLHNFTVYQPKPITITGTNTFNGNASTGLFAYSFGAIKANNITANDNGCDTLKDTDPSFCAGAYLDGKGVILSGAATFRGNARDGLLVYSYNAPISLSNVYAKDNGEHGALLYTYGSAAANITVSGMNTFLDNGEVGLLVISTGIVTLNNLTASGNGAEGVYVDNTNASTPKAVAIKGTNVFNGNGYGLVVYSYGAIIANNITALYNVDGVYLDNCNNSGPSCTGYSPQPVTMTGVNTISYNDYTGLDIRSSGAITVANITADFNLGGFGAYLDNWWDNAKGSVRITGYGRFSNNGDFNGLTVWSAGAITLANLTAEYNSHSGVVLFNDYNESTPFNITITGVNIFNGNGWNGLRIDTYGAVLLNNITANENGTTDEHAGVLVENHLGTLSRPVTLNGVNTFNDNYGTGLLISSLGAIKVSKVTANNNGLDGAVLDNQFGMFTAPITLLGYGVFNQNGENGLIVYSNGAVTASNVTASLNTLYGAFIDNYHDLLPTSAVNVTILGANTFNGNALGSGLMVYSDGQITLNNITANANGEYGAYLDNATYAGVVRNILLNGTNNFIGNTEGGLFFNASGSVFLTRVTAALNNDSTVGAPLSAGIFGTAGGNITLTCGNLFLNEGSGYFLSSGGVITLKGVFSYGNGDADSASGTPLITRTCPLP